MCIFWRKYPRTSSMPLELLQYFREYKSVTGVESIWEEVILWETFVKRMLGCRLRSAAHLPQGWLGVFQWGYAESCNVTFAVRKNWLRADSPQEIWRARRSWLTAWRVVAMLGSACIPRVRDWPGEWKGHNWFGQRIWRWHRSLDQQGFYLEMAELGRVCAEQALENRLSFDPSFHSPEIQPLLQICSLLDLFLCVHR